MSDTTALVNIGELSKPATVLIERVSDAIGGIFEPWQIRRVAQAKADANKIEAASQIEVTKLQRRALQRFLVEEAKKQNNIESITSKALPQVKADATPENIEADWITNFFDKCRLISDEEMQLLWSKVLAGEANSPGAYSKRTINFLSSLDKSDAILFQSLCSFGWLLGNVKPLIYDVENPIYNRHGINFNSLKHLDDIGLLSFDNLAGYRQIHLPKRVRVLYYGTPIDIEFENESENQLVIGHVLLSKIGQELASICDSEAIPEFFDYVLEDWLTKNVWISSPIGSKAAQENLRQAKI